MNSDELQDARDMAVLLMNEEATVVRAVEVQEGFNVKKEWVAQGTYPCRLAERESQGDKENTVGGRLVSQGEIVVRLPYGTSLNASDRLRLTLNGEVRTFEVARVLYHSYATTTSVACTEAR